MLPLPKIMNPIIARITTILMMLVWLASMITTRSVTREAALKMTVEQIHVNNMGWARCLLTDDDDDHLPFSDSCSSKLALMIATMEKTMATIVNGGTLSAIE